MLFNSLIFFVFLPIVFAGYWWIGERRWQNVWLYLRVGYVKSDKKGLTCFLKNKNKKK